MGGWKGIVQLKLILCKSSSRGNIRCEGLGRSVSEGATKSVPVAEINTV